MDKSARKRKIFNILKNILTKTTAGNILLANLAFFTVVIFQIVDSMFLNTGIMIFQYGLFLFLLGLTSIVANKHVHIFGQVESLNQSLSMKVMELNTAYTKLDTSKNKLKIMIENSNQVIFSLNTNFNFLVANKSLKKVLGFKPENLIGEKLETILFAEDDDHKFSNLYFLKKLEIFLDDKEEFIMPVFFKSVYHSEPIEMNLRLEYINTENHQEILCRASFLDDDKYIRLFVSEKRNYVIGNYLIQAEEISHLLVSNLARYIDKKEIANLRVSIREILINAIEHGNLGISYEEKTKMMLEGDYLQFVYERQKMLQYASKKVRISYSLRPKTVIYRITDEGNGFDHKNITKKTSLANENLLAHGRGITMSSQLFDRLVYNEKGNSVLLIKHIQKLKKE